MNARIEPVSDHSLQVTFGTKISPELHLLVKRLHLALLASWPAGVTNLHPAYASLTVDYNPLVTGFEEVARAVRAQMESQGDIEPGEFRRVEIPVCYGGAFGPDLEDVAAHCGLTPRQVIERHSAAEYLVYFLGFSPGFPYLGGLDPSLGTPRLATPRSHVAAGSIAIGGNQTGIYPLASPGGWRIIGRTAARLFNPERPPFALLSIGDRVRFRPIPGREFVPRNGR